MPLPLVLPHSYGDHDFPLSNPETNEGLIQGDFLDLVLFLPVGLVSLAVTSHTVPGLNLNLPRGTYLSCSFDDFLPWMRVIMILPKEEIHLYRNLNLNLCDVVSLHS